MAEPVQPIPKLSPSEYKKLLDEELWKIKTNNKNIKQGLTTGYIENERLQGCLFCNRDEPAYIYKPSKDVNYVCSRCTVALMQAGYENKLKAYNKAIRICTIRTLRQAEAIEIFMDANEGEEEIYVRNSETKHTGPSMERKRPLRKTKPAYGKNYRQKQANRKLD